MAEPFEKVIAIAKPYHREQRDIGPTKYIQGPGKLPFCGKSGIHQVTQGECGDDYRQQLGIIRISRRPENGGEHDVAHGERSASK